MATNPAIRTSITVTHTTPGRVTYPVNPNTGLPVSPPPYYASDADLAAAIDNWIRNHKPNSPLIGQGANFVAAGRAQGVDPTLLVGIANAESGLGTYKPIQAKHNPFGLGPGLTYPTWQSAINKAATVAKELGADRKTIDDVLSDWIYGPNRQSSQRASQNYLNAVQEAMAGIGSHPMSVVTPGSTDVAGQPASQGWGDSVAGALGNITNLFGDFLNILKAIFSKRGLMFVIGAVLGIFALIILSGMVKHDLTRGQSSRAMRAVKNVA